MAVEGMSDRWIDRPDIWAGAVLGGAAAVQSFRPSLMPRRTQHQALVTGASLVVGWAVANATYGLVCGNRSVEQDLKRLAATAAMGTAASLALTPRHDEPVLRALVRTKGQAAAAGAVAAAAAVSLRDNPQRWRIAPPLAAGALAAATLSIRQHLREQRDRHDEHDPKPPKALPAVGGGLAAGAVLGGVVQGYHRSGRVMARLLQKRFGMGAPRSNPAGRVVATGIWAGVGTGAYHTFAGGLRIYDRVLDPGYDNAPDTPLRSGSPESAVTFARIGRQGRRFVLDVPSPTDIADVMGTPPVADPIRAFVGWDSAKDLDGRIDLAMKELERTGAFERSLLIVNSPPGNGMCNPIPLETAEYLLLGDVASVSVQYDRMPSVLALHHTTLGGRYHRTLLERIRDELAARPADARPRVVVYGESQGAWTGQDAFLHGGTDALDELGVDRALWVGTPWYSGWRREMLGTGANGAAASDHVVEVDGPDDLYAIDPQRRSSLRVVILGHHNDPVCRLGLPLLVQRPDWLDGSRPPSVSPHQKWFPVLTGIQTIVDTLNAMNPVPGVFRATGHDYRLDLPSVTPVAWALPQPTPEQFERLMTRLQEAEAERAARFQRPTLPSSSDVPSS